MDGSIVALGRHLMPTANATRELSRPRRILPGMKILLDCPWCEAPLDLAGRDLPSEISCRECGVTVTVAIDSRDAAPVAAGLPDAA